VNRPSDLKLANTTKSDTRRLKVPWRLGPISADRSLNRRIVAGIFWSVAGSGIGQSLALGAAVVCARLLGSVQYGQLGIVLLTVNLFAIVGSIGLSITATKHVAEYRHSDPQRAGRVIGLSLLTAVTVGLAAAVAFFCVAPWLSRNILNAPQISFALQVAALMMLFAAINSYQVGTISGFEAFKVLAVLALIRGVVLFPMVLLGVVWGGLTGAVAGYSLAALVNFATHEVAIRRCAKSDGFDISYRFTSTEVRLLWSFSIPVMVAGLSFTPAAWWSSALLARTSGYSEMGLFNAAYQWQVVMLFLSSAASNIGLPMLSATIPEKAISKYRQLLSINFSLTTLLTLIVAIPVAVAAGWIMALYGHQFHGGAAVLRLLCLAAVLGAMNMTVGQAIWSLGAAVPGMLLALLRGLVLVVASYWLADEGALGLAMAYVLMGVVQTIVQAPFMLWLLRRQASAWAITDTAPEPAVQAAICVE
jgi:O-antigen/teichoic acid export membrane protein